MEIRKKLIVKLAGCLVGGVLIAAHAAAQTTVTTTGGTVNSVPKFNGSSNIINSAITENQGSVTIGSFAAPSSSTPGGFAVTGTGAALGFLRRTLSSWPANPAAGDIFAWYNPDGTARLFSSQTGDLLTITSNANATIGPFSVPPDPGLTGGLSITGTDAGLGFVRRTLASWPSTPAAGDLFAWYNPDGSAHLFASQNGDVLKVLNNGELDLVGALRFPDGSVQSTAASGSVGITRIDVGPGLTGGGVGPNVDLGLNGTVARTNIAQTFTGNQFINGNLVVSGTISSNGTIPATQILAGSCNTNSVNVTNFVLKGLGQDSSDSCSEQLGTITQDNPAGTLVTHTGTLSNLIARQGNFNSAGVGGTVIVWINHFTTTGVLSQTSIQCSLGALSQGTNADCTSPNTASITAGDKILVEVVLPPGAGTISPVAAEVTLSF